MFDFGIVKVISTPAGVVVRMRIPALYRQTDCEICKVWRRWTAAEFVDAAVRSDGELVLLFLCKRDHE